uniref:Uncharacterized protein n=1 Tax=Rhizophora mucronata TaxID=61149 RepID=A0A2P2N6R0_RHIMU
MADQEEDHPKATHLYPSKLVASLIIKLSIIIPTSNTTTALVLQLPTPPPPALHHLPPLLPPPPLHPHLALPRRASWMLLWPSPPDLARSWIRPKRTKKIYR